MLSAEQEWRERWAQGQLADNFEEWKGGARGDWYAVSFLLFFFEDAFGNKVEIEISIEFPSWRTKLNLILISSFSQSEYRCRHSHPPRPPRHNFTQVSTTTTTTTNAVTSVIRPAPPSTTPLTSAPSASRYFEVKRSARGGYGVFATQIIAEGTQILLERPLFQATAADLHQVFGGLSEEEQALFMALHGWDCLSEDPIISRYLINR